MKMAEHDWETRSDRACVQMITLLESVTTYVVDEGNKPPAFEQLQFSLFEVAKKKSSIYSECREMVEWTCQLLFSFVDVYVDLALETLDMLKALMRDDTSPTTIHLNIYQHLTVRLDKYNAERICSTVSNFIQQFIDDNNEQISYL